MLIICAMIDDARLTIVCLLFVNCFILWISCNSFRVVKTPDERTLQISEWVYEKFVERFGLFVMVTSGESILVLMTSTNTFIPIWEDYVVCFLLFAITFGMRDIYFEGANILDLQDHALMVKTSPGSIVWTIFHGLLGFFLTICGTGWKLLFKTLDHEVREGQPVKHNYLLILGFAQAGSIFCMYMIRWAHRKFIMNIYSFVMRVPALIALPLGAQYMESSLGYSFYLFFWVWFTFILDHLLIERWQYEVREDLRPFYGEHNAMGKLQVNRGKSAASVLGHETVNALEMHVAKTNYNIEGIKEEELNETNNKKHNKTKQHGDKSKNNKKHNNETHTKLKTENKSKNKESNAHKNAQRVKSVSPDFNEHELDHVDVINPNEYEKFADNALDALRNRQITPEPAIVDIQREIQGATNTTNTINTNNTTNTTNTNVGTTETNPPTNVDTAAD